MEHINLSKYSWAKDIPDTRDFLSEELVWALPIVTLPDRVILDQTPYLNQWPRLACTVFGTSWAWFETLSQILTAVNEPYKQPFDPWNVWNIALQRWASDSSGWYIQSALQLLTDLWLIWGYVKIGEYGKANSYAIRYWNHKGFTVVTWSAKWDWEKVIATGKYAEQKWNAGHCFYFNWYEKGADNKVKNHAPNSWNWLGDFWLDFDTYWTVLFTQYIIIETKDIAILNELRWKRKANALIKAREYKLWNGERPWDIATDKEITIMVHRALNITSAQTRAWYASIFQKRILQWKAELPIWNKKEWEKIATEMEIATMFTRASRKNASVSSGIMKREDVAVICARDLIT